MKDRVIGGWILVSLLNVFFVLGEIISQWIKFFTRANISSFADKCIVANNIVYENLGESVIETVVVSVFLAIVNYSFFKRHIIKPKRLVIVCL